MSNKMRNFLALGFIVTIGLVSTAYLTPIGGGGGGGGVTAVTGSSPIISTGGTTPQISCQLASGSQSGCITAANFTAFSGALTSPMTTLGDTLYENSTPAAARLPGNITTSREFYSETGTGTVSAAPAWGVLLSGDIPNNAANTTGTAANITATTNGTLTTLSALSLPGSQVSGPIPGDSAGLTGGLGGQIVYQSAANTTAFLANGTAGQILKSNGTTTAPSWVSPPVGTVTSVGLADTSTTPIYMVINSPITSSGTIDFALNTETANTIFSGPATGSAAQPTFRSLVSADIPNNAANTTGTASNITGTTNSTLTTLPSLSLPYSQLTGVPAALTFTTPLSLSGSTVSISQANTSTNGFLSSTDWNTFNSKQAAGNYITALTGDVTAAGPGSAAASLTATTNNTLTTLSALALPTTQLTGSVALTQLASQAADTFVANGTGSSAVPTAISAATAASILPPFIGDSGAGGTQGLVPAPPTASSLAGDFLSAGGSWAYVDQSKTTYPSFSLIEKSTNVPSGAIKYENTVLYTSIVNGKQYALGTGFIGSPTLSIWDVSDQTNPINVGNFTAAGGGIYNVTVGVVSGVQYAFVGYNSGSHFVVVNLTNPASPVQTSSTVITGSPGSIYGVSFLNGYVYCATQNAGLTVMDVGGGTGTPAIPVQTFQQGGGAKSFGVVAIGTNVYTTLYSTSIPFTVRQIVSWTLTSPGTAAIPSQLQSLQVTAAGEALGMSINGNTAFVTTAATGAYNINLVDITSPSAMTNLSQVNSSNNFNSAFYAVGSGNYMYVPSGANATYGGAIDVYDITTRTSPVHIAQVTTGVATSTFGGIAISGGYIFAADYGAGAGTASSFDVFKDMNETSVNGAITASTINAVTSITSPLFTGNLTGTASLATNMAGGLGGQIPYQSAANTSAFLANGTSGQVLQSNGGTTAPSWANPSPGTVTSVGFADASTAPIYTITGSPVTGSGTLTQTLSTQTANTVFAGPGTGSAAQPSFRALVSADIPSNAANTSGNAATATALAATPTGCSAGQYADAIAANGNLTCAQVAYSQISGTPSAITALTGDVTATGPGSAPASLIATTNGTLTTLSALSLPLSQTTGVLPITKGGTNNGSLSVAAGTIYYGDGSKINSVAPGTSGQYLKSGGSGAPTWSASSFTPIAPTVQILSGSGTYNPTSGSVLYIRVTMVGGGGGGGGASNAGSSSATAGTNSTFSTLTAGGGGAGGPGLSTSLGNGGAAGTATGNSNGLATVGNPGAGGIGGIGAAVQGGNGGASIIGGGGLGGYASSGINGTTGSGGGGAGQGTGSLSAGGGGSGGYINTIISGSALTTIISSGASYSVGAGGNGGVGTSGYTGGNGGAGYIQVEEFYQ